MTTPPIANVQLTNTFDYWRQRTNDLIRFVNNSANGSVGVANIYTANLTVSNNLSTDSFFVTGNTALSGSLTITGPASYSNNVIVSGSLNVSQDVTHDSNTSIQGSLSVTGNTSVSNTTVGGSLNVIGDVTHDSNTTLAGTTTALSPVNVSNTLTVQSDSIFSSNVNILRSLNVTQTAVFSNTVSFVGNIFANDVMLSMGNTITQSVATEIERNRVRALAANTLATDALNAAVAFSIALG